MRCSLIILCWILGHSALAQTVKQKIRKMQWVRFQQPVMVLVRLNDPVPDAEYRVVMNRSLVSQLDTLTLQGLLHHPGIYFFGTNGRHIGRKSYPFRLSKTYTLTGPETVNKPDTIKNVKFSYAELKRPKKSRLYTTVESSEFYKHWVVRKGESDSEYSVTHNTLPAVDSVRTVYAIIARTHQRMSARKRRIMMHSKG